MVAHRPPSAHRQPRVSIQSAAEHYGVSERTVRRWIAEGRLTAYRVGPRLIRVDLSEPVALERKIPTAG